MKKLFSFGVNRHLCRPAERLLPDEDNKVKVAINTGPDEAIWKVVEQVAKDKYHLDVEVVSFNDYVLPNEALNNKDVDANAFQDPAVPWRRSRKNAAINLQWSVKPLSSLSPPILTGSKISANCPKGRR